VRSASPGEPPSRVARERDAGVRERATVSWARQGEKSGAIRACREGRRSQVEAACRARSRRTCSARVQLAGGCLMRGARVTASRVLSAPGTPARVGVPFARSFSEPPV
jgi:hypothetical protein